LRYIRPLSIVTGTSNENKERNLLKIYETIANNLTEGERGQEADYYFQKICGRCIRNPRDQAVIQSAKRFRDALAEDHYTEEAVILSVVLFIAKTALGRVVFTVMVKSKELLNSR